MRVRLVAFRHAKPLTASFADDSLYPLSLEGIEAQKRLLEKIAAAGICVDQLYSSSLLRARQTAELISNTFGVPLVIERALGSSFNGATLLELLRKGGSSVGMVGHAPTLANWVNELVGGNALPLGLSNSSAAVIDFVDEVDYGQGELVAFYRAS